MIENLGSQIFQEIGSLLGVKDELQSIKSAVSRIQAVLQDAAEQQNHNHQVRDWLEKPNDVVYDADDLLGEFFTEASRRRAKSGNKIKKEIVLSWQKGAKKELVRIGPRLLTSLILTIHANTMYISFSKSFLAKQKN
ncbi:disease resistance protein RGA2-like isoform X2 [Quercus suber]|uniref:disease resistance protein RGA2-like isoform X2 n=1 Tax=Quercus suber TaxID=58331 RepID=UPI0032DE7E35